MSLELSRDESAINTKQISSASEKQCTRPSIHSLVALRFGISPLRDFFDKSVCGLIVWALSLAGRLERFAWEEAPMHLRKAGGRASRECERVTRLKLGRQVGARAPGGDESAQSPSGRRHERTRRQLRGHVSAAMRQHDKTRPVGGTGGCATCGPTPAPRHQNRLVKLNTPLSMQNAKKLPGYIFLQICMHFFSKWLHFYDAVSFHFTSDTQRAWVYMWPYLCIFHAVPIRSSFEQAWVQLRTKSVFCPLKLLRIIS